MSRFVKMMVALLAITTVAAPAMAATFAVHGDLNHRFNLYTNHSELYSGAGSLEQGVDSTKINGLNVDEHHVLLVPPNSPAVNEECSLPDASDRQA